MEPMQPMLRPKRCGLYLQLLLVLLSASVLYRCIVLRWHLNTLFILTPEDVNPSKSSLRERRPQPPPTAPSTPYAAGAFDASALRPCPSVPPHLKGRHSVLVRGVTLDDVESSFPQLQMGGAWRPSHCLARHRVAIIVPFRDRAAHLAALLKTLHPMLQRQELDYRIFVVEQADPAPFNRAMLMNIGFVEALKLYDFQCFIFHDVDLLPEDDRNLYTCPEQPRHLSAAINTDEYRLPYHDIFGGVSAMTTAQVQKVNGFSNIYWGWGGEDDDMSNRIKNHGFHIIRYPPGLARYTMLLHRKQIPNPERFHILYSGPKRFKTDGLNSLRYARKELNLYRTYTRLLVELPSPSRWNGI